MTRKNEPKLEPLPRKTTEQLSYRTTDGKLHNSPVEARDHQHRLDLRELLERRGIGRGGEWSTDMIADELIAAWDDLVAIMAEC